MCRPIAKYIELRSGLQEMLPSGHCPLLSAQFDAMKKMINATFLTVLAASALSGQNITSIYSPLSGNSCTLVKEDKETDNSIHRCPGPVPDLAVLVAYDDQRMSVSLVLAEGKQEHPLDLWTLVTRSFSSLGPRAEWRIVRKARKNVPLAMIVRVNATDGEGRKSSYLAISKVTAEQACVVEVIPAIAENRDANSRARQIADKSTEKACLQGTK